MILKLSIVIAIFNAFIRFQVHQLDAEIKDRTDQMIELKAEIAQAQKTVGLAETIDYVEKIGFVSQLEEQIFDLEQQKIYYEKRIKSD